METTEINLTFNRKDFEEIYFANRQANIFFSPTTKKHFLMLLIFSVAFIIMLLVSVYTNTFIFGFVVLLLITTLAAFNFVRRAYYLSNWRNRVKMHLDNISKHQRHKVILTDTAITVVMDDEELIEKWTAVDGATINNDYISLSTPHNHLFPRKAMSEKDYEVLKTFISNKVRSEP
jgi:c-di-AMP phosphodiesterase-like protein